MKLIVIICTLGNHIKCHIKCQTRIMCLINIIIPIVKSVNSIGPYLSQVCNNINDTRPYSSQQYNNINDIRPNSLQNTSISRILDITHPNYASIPICRT